MKAARVMAGLAVGVLLVALASLGDGEALSSPASRPIGTAPADLDAKTVSIPNGNGGTPPGRKPPDL